MKEKSKVSKGLSKKLMITISSVVVCLLLVSVVVYAALTQTVNLTNTITVSTGGQAKATVTVYETALDGNEAVAALPSEPTWGEAILTKDKDTDKADQALTPIMFEHSTNKNVYAYKIVITNESTTTNATITITSSAESNSEIDVYAGEEFASASKLDNTAGVNFSKTDVAPQAEVTYYIIVAANKDLANMTATTAQTFNIDVTVAAA